MPNSRIADEIPGIKSLAKFRPSTGKPLTALAETILRGPSPLTHGERELIAAYVSYKNNSMFVYQGHAAAARRMYGAAGFLVNEVMRDPNTATISKKLKILLRIAGKVQVSGLAVKQQDVDEAKSHGASDREVHDTVLIASVFCMINRYVEGMNNFTRVGKEKVEDN
ncbi:carboxymuconolactone decarboxylase [Pollutibacter soli]|uniref:carboxymuconolactone decarboxylase family protein n=1 Tax=Pollutibacter soli TaxID=3034157 RepID=UPI0030139650